MRTRRLQIKHTVMAPRCFRILANGRRKRARTIDPHFREDSDEKRLVIALDGKSHRHWRAVMRGIDSWIMPASIRLHRVFLSWVARCAVADIVLQWMEVE